MKDCKHKTAITHNTIIIL